MKYIAAILPLLILYLPSRGQDLAEVTVTGKAVRYEKPTVVVINATIRTENEQYATAVEELTARADLLVNKLQKLGFKKEEITSSVFSITKSYLWNTDRSKRKEGYAANQDIKVSFAYSVRRLLEILNTITTGEAKPNVSISFDLDDATKAKVADSLIELAMKDAKNKAEVIAKTAGLKIKGIKKINYAPTYAAPRAFTRSFNEARVADAANVNHFEAANLTFRDQIEIIYYLAKY